SCVTRSRATSSSPTSRSATTRARSAAPRCGPPGYHPPRTRSSSAEIWLPLEARMGTVDFDAFDADNHYYEATDSFTRHLPAEYAKTVQWAEIGGKQRMIVDNKIFRFIPNPTFDPVARPGCLDEYFRGKVAGD